MTKDIDQVEQRNLDALYDKAVALVLNCRHPSCSYLQRHLRLGYSDTQRLIAKMEMNGIDHRISATQKIPDPLIIKIVLIGGASSKDIEKLMARNALGIEFVVIETKKNIVDSVS